MNASRKRRAGELRRPGPTAGAAGRGRTRNRHCTIFSPAPFSDDWSPDVSQPFVHSKRNGLAARLADAWSTVAKVRFPHVNIA